MNIQRQQINIGGIKMNIKDKLLETVENSEHKMTMQEYEALLKAVPNDLKVENAFKQSAGTYWGKIGKVRVTATKQSSKGTKYYLVIADIIKDGERLKLLQEWYVGQDGIAKPAIKKNITIPDEYASEISILLDEEFEMEE